MPTLSLIGVYGGDEKGEERLAAKLSILKPGILVVHGSPADLEVTEKNSQYYLGRLMMEADRPSFTHDQRDVIREAMTVILHWGMNRLRGCRQYAIDHSIPIHYLEESGTPESRLNGRTCNILDILAKLSDRMGLVQRMDHQRFVEQAYEQARSHIYLQSGFDSFFYFIRGKQKKSSPNRFNLPDWFKNMVNDKPDHLAVVTDLDQLGKDSEESTVFSKLARFSPQRYLASDGEDVRIN